MEMIRKPWGRYFDYYRSRECVFKIIEVDPGCRLSLQRHQKRDEIWNVLSGGGVARINNEDVTLRPRHTVTIRAGSVHRISNDGSVALVIAEMQIGDCNEADIIRLEDDYGR